MCTLVVMAWPATLSEIDRRINESTPGSDDWSDLVVFRRFALRVCVTRSTDAFGSLTVAAKSVDSDQEFTVQELLDLMIANGWVTRSRTPKESARMMLTRAAQCDPPILVRIGGGRYRFAKRQEQPMLG
jgi:hypothetical protein